MGGLIYAFAPSQKGGGELGANVGQISFLTVAKGPMYCCYSNKKNSAIDGTFLMVAKGPMYSDGTFLMVTKGPMYCCHSNKREWCHFINNAV
jgi:hypothetical protein